MVERDYRRDVFGEPGYGKWSEQDATTFWICHVCGGWTRHRMNPLAYRPHDHAESELEHYRGTRAH